jgi:ATP-dependent Clp protease ATP-binding subunit ClpA
MRRVVQRTVENMVARQMLAGGVAPGSVIRINLEDVRQILGGEGRISSPAQADTNFEKFQ